MRIILWVVLSRSLRVKALEFAAFVVRVWENTTSSLNLSLSQQENTQTLGGGSLQAKRCPNRESFGIGSFGGLCMREYDLIWLTQGIFKITVKQFAREDFGFAPLT